MKDKMENKIEKYITIGKRNRTNPPRKSLSSNPCFFNVFIITPFFIMLLL